MLDMVISFITFVMITIKGLISYFLFRPPNPQAYRTKIITEDQTTREKVYFLKRGVKSRYESIEFTTIRHEFKRIPDSNGNFIPAIIITPINAFKLCIIYSHGNSCDIGVSFFECVDIALNTNCSVILYEYPGYGLCTNKKLTEENIYYNIRKVYSFIVNELAFSAEEIVLYGHSLGTGPTIDLAVDEKYPVSALVLQAPFLSILRTIANFDKTPFFDYFANIDKIPKLKTPLLILHGTKDNIIHFEDGEKLSKLVEGKYLYEFFTIPNGDHNDLIRNHKGIVYKKLREFLSKTTKINFSADLNHSNIDMSEFFKKLQKPNGDEDPVDKINEESKQEKIMELNLRKYIEIESGRNNQIELGVFNTNEDHHSIELNSDKRGDIKVEVLDEKNQNENIENYNVINVGHLHEIK